MNRRQLLKLLAAGGVGSISNHVLDIDRLLWVPGEKTIFIPAKLQVISGAITLEMMQEAIKLIQLPHIKAMFNRDDLFYKIIERSQTKIVARNMRIPLEINWEAKKK